MKILILTASPIRDKYIDRLIADELKKRGHEVWVKPCLREGRDAVLNLQPDTVVIPPIRNVYSRDFAENIQRFGCKVISRHTEPSCDWSDFKKMNQKQKMGVMGYGAYSVDAEMVWGGDEADILTKRNLNFPVYAIGAVGLDIYRQDDLKKELFNKAIFNNKYKFSNKRKTLLIASAWGFADSAPDLQIEEIKTANLDTVGKKRHLKMIENVHRSLGDSWNILVTTHPGVLEDPYTQLCQKLGIPLDTESPMMEMLGNCDALIHAGSTAAISAHCLNIPAYQYGDVNAKDEDSWWGMPESTISQVSPYFKTTDDLIAAIKKSRRVSNADKKTLKALETGRYGSMDGKAYIRAANIIEKYEGKFKLVWPESTTDYSQLGIVKKPEQVLLRAFCGICKHNFYYIHQDWQRKLNDRYKTEYNLFENVLCPWCGSKLYLK